MPEQEQRQAAVPGAQRGAELGDVGDQPVEARRAEVPQPALGTAAMPAVIGRMHQETGRIERLREARA